MYFSKPTHSDKIGAKSIIMNVLPKEKTYNLIILKTGNGERAGERQNEKWEQNKKMGSDVTGTKFEVFFTEFWRKFENVEASVWRLF